MHFSRLTRWSSIAVLLVAAQYFLFAQSGYKQTKPLDLANMDTTVSPCQDFYRFSNGGWLDRNPVPPAYSNWGSMSELTERNNEILHTILDEAAAKTNLKKGSIYQLVGDFYASGMDTVRIDEEGVKPLAAEFAKLNRIKTAADLQGALVRFHLAITNPLFQTSSQQDFKNSDEVIVSIDQSGLTLPDRDYYLDESDRFKTIRKEYHDYMVKMFILLGDDKAAAEKNAKTVMTIETRLAKASMEREQLRDPHAVYHKMSVGELKRLAPAFNWQRYLLDMNLRVKDLNVSQPEFIKEVNAMLKSVPIKEWKTYLRWQLADETAPFLSQRFVDTRFAFHGTVLNGQKVLQPRWKRVLQTVDNLVGEALGQMYTERTFTPQAKERALTMVKNLQAAFRERLASLSWMSEATRAKALEKIDAFDLKIGYPDKWKSYDGVSIDRQSYVQNVLRTTEFETRRQLAKVGKPVDRTEWFMTPPTVNAYYNPLMNEIVFPAGILQPPFFDPNADDAVNYGGMGAVIGHEITHGFDDQGRQFDAKGNLTDWWTKEDGERFEQLAKIVEEQFSGYVAIDTLKVNGKFTLGENIADLGGLAIAYHALQKVLDQKPMLQKIDGFTPQQRFFFAWGQMWRRNYTPQNLRQRLVVDPHSPSQFRSNGPLSNMKEFFDAFGCGAKAAMVRPAELQVKIW
ncbi:MAG: M13 family metallopeptidase [Ignavibacteriae bacterium]|nr:M13 family metallopeptidase [Ignavibacteriota bacterium]